MGKEYEIIKDLGYKNWIDETAGLAVLLGSAIHDPVLQIRGTDLAKMIKEIPYDSDDFYKVEVNAAALAAELDRVRSDLYSVAYLDVFTPERLSKAHKDIEFQLLKFDNEYQISISVAEFYSDNELLEPEIVASEDVIKEMLGQSYRGAEIEDKTDFLGYERQKIHTIRYWSGHRLIREIVIHDHEGKTKRGFLEKFNFEDFSTAMIAWKKIRETILSQTK